MLRVFLCTVICFGAIGCGGRPAPKPVDTLDTDTADLPSGAPKITFQPQAAVQLYVVLTADPSAMQDQAARDAMWKTVGGHGPRAGTIRKQVEWVPEGYELAIELDFANIPHPKVDHKQLLAIARKTSPALGSKAKKAKLAVFFRSNAPTLPGGDHIRLAGLAAYHAATTYDGVIIDLITRRAWSADTWYQELSAKALSEKQVRLSARPDKGQTRWLFTRGHAKYGLPDLQIRGVSADALPAAQTRLGELAALLRARAETLGTSAKVGDVITLPSGAVTLEACDAPAGLFDGGCAQIR